MKSLSSSAKSNIGVSRSRVEEVESEEKGGGGGGGDGERGKKISKEGDIGGSKRQGVKEEYSFLWTKPFGNHEVQEGKEQSAANKTRRASENLIKVRLDEKFGKRRQSENWKEIKTLVEKMGFGAGTEGVRGPRRRSEMRVEIQVRIVLKILLSMLKIVEIQVKMLFMSMLKMGAFEGAADIGCLLRV